MIQCSRHPVYFNTCVKCAQANGEQIHVSTLKDKMIDYTNEEQLTGKKDDQGKPDLSLLPRAFLEGTARALMYGVKKYGRYNYANGLDWHRIIAGIMRHAVALNDGEDIDPESGLPHIDHMGAGIAMLKVHITEGLGKDTRRKK